MESLLRALGHEPVGALAGTAERVTRTWGEELLAGERLDADAILRDGASETTPQARGQLVLLRGLAVVTICPHHLLPAHGHADRAYLPGPRRAGLGQSAPARAACTRRLTPPGAAGVPAPGSRGARAPSQG